MPCGVMREQFDVVASWQEAGCGMRAELVWVDDDAWGVEGVLAAATLAESRESAAAG